MSPRHKRFTAALVYSLVLYIGACFAYSHFIPKMVPLVYLVALFVAVAAYMLVYSALALLVFDHNHVDAYYNRIAHFGNGYSKQYINIYEDMTRRPKTMIVVFDVLSFAAGTATLFPLGHDHPQWSMMFVVVGLSSTLLAAAAWWFAARLEEAGQRWCKLIWEHAIDDE